MVSSPLFRLPRELRDQIYQYALYNANGLLYQTCSDGVGRLCRRPRASSIRTAIITWLHRCSFRQMGRKYKGHAIENNQLKYVCRRLYDETKGLDLHYNLIVFQDAVAMNALEQCTFLLRRCPTVHAVAIKCSSQSFASNYSERRFSTIVRHCTIHKNVQVRIHIPYWSQRDPNCMPLGLGFLSSLRTDTSLAAQLARTTFLGSLLNSELEVLPAPVQMPCNLRFFPKEERFDPQIFERSCRKNPLIRLPTTQAAMGEVMRLVEGWFQNGL